MNDKTDIEQLLKGRDTVVVELGCGDRKRIAGSIGIDLRDGEGVDVVGDVLEVLNAFPDGSIDGIHSHHCLEHIENIEGLFRQLSRTVRKGGSMSITVPHFSNPFFYSDPTHKTPFGLYTFAYFADAPFFKRSLPQYAKTAFEIRDLRLIFKSYRPRYLRHAWKKAVEFFVNLNVFTMELYEEMFCYLVPCYEIRLVLVRT